MFCRTVERRPVGTKRLVSCAELVLDVDAKTQRVILKKKVRLVKSMQPAPPKEAEQTRFGFHCCRSRGNAPSCGG